MNEEKERERVLESIAEIGNCFNTVFNQYNILNLPNLGYELNNKIIALSVLFYSRGINCYSSPLMDPIFIYLLRLVEEGATLLTDYITFYIDTITDINYDSEKGLYSNESFINSSDIFRKKYISISKKIEIFDIRKDILEASKNMIIKYKEKYDDETIERIICLFNSELNRLKIERKLPSLYEFNKIISEEEKGKEKRK